MDFILNNKPHILCNFSKIGFIRLKFNKGVVVDVENL